MNKIKFSHRYVKMPHSILDGHEKTAKLLAVFNTTRARLGNDFMEYDTKTLGGEHYSLPNGSVLVLLLRSLSGEIWTTVREWNPEKEKYYRSQTGKDFEIEILEEQ